MLCVQLGLVGWRVAVGGASCEQTGLLMGDARRLCSVLSFFFFFLGVGGPTLLLWERLPTSERKRVSRRKWWLRVSMETRCSRACCLAFRGGRGGGWEQTEARRKKRRGERVRAEPVLGGKGKEGKARTSHTRLWQIQ